MNTESTDRKKDPQTYKIIGAAMAVHWYMGHGFLEAVYQEAMEIECSARGIPWSNGGTLHIEYRGQQLKQTYQPDLLCYGAVLVELKAIAHLTTADEGQLINYLKATRLHRGLLLNFGGARLEYKRLVFGPDERASVGAAASNHLCNLCSSVDDPSSS